MYVRTVPSKQKHGTYHSVQIVESYRDRAKSKYPITRILANLGQADKLTDRDVDNIINGLCKILGRPTSEDATWESVWDFGHVFALLEIWKHLKIGTILKQKAKKTGQSFDLEAHIRLMVVNRLCDPTSKLGLLQWLEGVYLPGINRDEVEYHHLLRAMDWLIEHKEQVEKEIANSLLTLFNRDVDLVFYDITSSYFEGDHSITEDDIRRYGYSRDHRPERRQVVIGVVMTREGIPLCHHVFHGATPDKSTVREVVRDLKERFGLKRVIFVGDRGMLSEENLEYILEEDLGFIVCHRLRQNNEIKDLITDTHEGLDTDPGAGKQYREEERKGVKFVMAYDPEIASAVRKRREAAIEKAQEFIQDIRSRLCKAREGKTRGRPLTPEGALLQVRDYLKRHNILRCYELELDPVQGLRVTSNSQARRWEKLIDGKLVVETTLRDLAPELVIKRYKELQIIERGFRCLKSTLKLRPVYHWTERRIRAHVFLCVIALQMERYMTARLEGTKISVQTALAKLRQIKAGHMMLNSAKTTMLTAPSEEHKAIYRQLELSFPKIKHLHNV